MIFYGRLYFNVNVSNVIYVALKLESNFFLFTLDNNESCVIYVKEGKNTCKIYSHINWHYHQCRKDFWPRLFLSFCLGFRPEAYWDETKRRNLWSVAKDQSYRGTFLLRVYENRSHLHTSTTPPATAPPTWNNAQNNSVTGA